MNPSSPTSSLLINSLVVLSLLSVLVLFFALVWKNVKTSGHLEEEAAVREYTNAPPPVTPAWDSVVLWTIICLLAFQSTHRLLDQATKRYAVQASGYLQVDSELVSNPRINFRYHAQWRGPYWDPGVLTTEPPQRASLVFSDGVTIRTYNLLEPGSFAERENAFLADASGRFGNELGEAYEILARASNALVVAGDYGFDEYMWDRSTTRPADNSVGLHWKTRNMILESSIWLEVLRTTFLFVWAYVAWRLYERLPIVPRIERRALSAA